MLNTDNGFSFASILFHQFSVPSAEKSFLETSNANIQFVFGGAPFQRLSLMRRAVALEAKTNPGMFGKRSQRGSEISNFAIISAAPDYRSFIQ